MLNVFNSHTIGFTPLFSSKYIHMYIFIFQSHFEYRFICEKPLAQNLYSLENNDALNTFFERFYKLVDELSL
jgi:hypothetical protein